MRDYTIPRNFRLAHGMIVEIAFLSFAGHWLATITRDRGHNLPDVWVGRSDKNPVQALKAARLQQRLDTDPEFKAVYKRLKVNLYDNSTIEALRRHKEKIFLTDKNMPPKKIHVNSRAARTLKLQLEMYREPAKLAGLNLPIIIVDDSLPDGKALKE